MNRMQFYIFILIHMINGLKIESLTSNGETLLDDMIIELFSDETYVSDDEEVLDNLISERNRQIDKNVTKSDNILVTNVGYGWDNLRNEKRLPVLSNGSNDSKQIDPHTNLLVSADMEVIYYDPVQEEYRSQIFPHWNGYSDWDCTVLNEDGDFEFNASGVSGSFSTGYQEMKRKRIKNGEVTARFQLVYKSHSLGLGLNNLSSDFKKRVDEMINLAEAGREKHLDYYAESLVRAYGTHFIDKVDLGFTIIEEDALSAGKLFTYFHSLDAEIDVMAAGSEHFFNKINNNQLTDVYETLVSFSSLLVYGYVNNSVVQNLPLFLWPPYEKPAVVLKYGKSLDKVIIPENFPQKHTKLVQQHVHQAIQRYYDTNTYPGCLKLESPNFDLWANKQENSCQIPKTHFLHFGGMFQTCNNINQNYPDPCINARIANIATGNLSCSNSFKETLLYEGFIVYKDIVSECSEVCERTWLFFKSCHTQCNEVVSERKGMYQIYWCRSELVKNETDISIGKVLFGGLFSNETVNPITGKHSCPPVYDEMQFAEGLYVCLSDDNDGAREHMIEISEFSNVSDNLINFICPVSYFKKSVIINKNVEFFYCVRSANGVNYEKLSFPHIIYPPFSSLSSEIDDVIGDKTKEKEDLSKEEIIGLITAVVLVVLLMIILVCILVWRCKYKKSKGVITNYKDIDSEMIK